MKTKSILIFLFLFSFINSQAQKQAAAVDTIFIQTLVDSCKTLKDNGDYRNALTIGQNGLNLIETAFSRADGQAQKFLKTAQATTLRNMGNAYKELSDLPNALEYYKRCLKIAEVIGDKMNIGGAVLNTGVVYLELDSNIKAMEYLQRGLKVFSDIGNKRGLAICYESLGRIYSNLSNDSLALEYYERAINLYDEMDNKRGKAQSLNNIASIYEKQKRFAEALDNYEFSLKMFKEEGDSANMAFSLAGIGNIYSNGEKNQKKAEPFYVRALDLAKKSNDLDLQTQSFNALKDVYKEQGRYKEAFEMYDQYVYAKDSLLKMQNAEGIHRNEMQNNFNEKQELQKAENDKQTAIAKEKDKRQKAIILAVIAGLLLVVVFSVFMFNRWRITQKQKKVIEKQKEEVDKQRELADSRRIIAEEQKLVIQEQKTEVEKSKREVDEKNKDITDSINYAQRIQRAVLPHRRDIMAAFPESFVLFKPKDIVSGDFYWAFSPLPLKREVGLPAGQARGEVFYLACCDCTGHGVPGAFMSLLNISFLNQAVNEKEIREPDKILNEVRLSIVKALNPDGNEERKDGMDAVLCAIDLKNKILHAACANNPIWYIQNGELKEIKPDKMPVGSHTNIATPFTKHSIQLQPGDSVYLFTDGYADQFGGPKNKKFRYKQLKEILLGNTLLPMKMQKDILQKAFEDWQGKCEQIDDVLVIGIRI